MASPARAAHEDGAVLEQAREDKEATYPELVSSHRCRLVVLAIETGGRWSEEAVAFLRQLALAKAREAPRHAQLALASVWERRWTRMLASSCARAFAASVLDPQRALTLQPGCSGVEPSVGELWAQDPRG